MPTQQYYAQVADGWVQFAGAEDEFMVEARIGTVQITFQDSDPGADAPFHNLPSGQVMVRSGTGVGYFRSGGGGYGSGSASVVVTT